MSSISAAVTRSFDARATERKVTGEGNAWITDRGCASCHATADPSAVTMPRKTMSLHRQGS